MTSTDPGVVHGPRAIVSRGSGRVTASTAVGAIAMMAVVAIWIGVGIVVRHLRHDADSAARRELGSHASLLADHADRTMQSVDLLLSLLVSRVEQNFDAGSADPSLLHRILRDGLAGMPQIRSALVLAPDGHSIGDATVATPRAFNGADRAYFQVHRDRDHVGLFIGDPVQSRINQLWAISLSKRLSTPDGRFAGVVVAAVDPGYFASLHARTESQQGAAVTLIKRTGVVLATTHEERDRLLGQPVLPDLSPIATVVDHSGLGLIDVGFPDPARPRVTAVAAARIYPVVTLASRAGDAITEESQDSVELAVVAGAATSLLVLALAWLLSRHFRSMEQRFRNGIESMSDGFMLWDSDERLIVWNSRYEAMIPAATDVLRVGVPHAELLRRVVPRARPEESPEKIDALIAERLARFRNPQGPWEIRLRDDRIIEIEETRSATGEVVSIFRDITARKRHEADLERALVAEREVSLLHRQFIVMASHEFRTPLAIIDGGAQRILARHATENEDLRRRVGLLRGAVTRMTDLIDRLLSSARLDEGGIKLECAPFVLGPLLQGIRTSQLQVSPDFDIRLEMPDEPLVIDGDVRLLGQVFTNIVNNAVKYSGRSRRIEIGVSTTATEISVAIRDAGVGIPPEEMDRLFTRFFRARTAMGITGTGIGLNLSRELVRLHGGRIDVRSDLDRGSCFTVTLRRAVDLAAAA